MGVVTVIDLETTGLDHKLDRILEIGAVRLEDDRPAAEFHRLIDPGVPLRSSNIAIHGITADMVRGCPPLEEVLPSFLEFLGDAPIVAHNVTFDHNFLSVASLQILGRQLSFTLIDTMDLAREVFPREKALSLERLLQLMDRPAENLHRALNDARALAGVFPELKRRFEQKLSWHRGRFSMVDSLASRYLQLSTLIEALREEEAEVRRTLELFFTENQVESLAMPGGALIKLERRESWEFHADEVRAVLAEAGILDRVTRVDRAKLDRYLKSDRLSAEHKEAILSARRFLGFRHQIAVERPS